MAEDLLSKGSFCADDEKCLEQQKISQINVKLTNCLLVWSTEGLSWYILS